MDGSLKWSCIGIDEQQKRRQLIGRLKAARNKLTPIIDDIISSACDLIQRGDDRFVHECTLTLEQYQDVIWASQILREIEYEFRTDNKSYILPNSIFIVNNVSVDYKSKMMKVKDKSIIIDEATVIELLELYEQMGVVINHMVNEGIRVNVEPTSKSTTNIDDIDRNVSKSRSTSSSKRVGTPQSSTTEFHETSGTPDYSDRDVSAPINSSSGNIPYSEPVTSDDTENSKPCAGGPTIFIKIRCFSDGSDADNEEHFISTEPIKCPGNCLSHYHIKLDGDPLSFKVNQESITDGTVYCINTGGDQENDIRIVIKQCPECMSTVIGSSTKIKDAELGESHESITLHGKGGDESKMAYSNSDDSGIMRQAFKEKDRVSKISQRTVRDQKVDSQPKMDVLIDVDNVDQSTVKVHGQPSVENDAGAPPRDASPSSFNRGRSSLDHSKQMSRRSLIREPSTIMEVDPGIPLTRRRLCSSMEFDVATANTRLRDHEIEHANAHIVVELKKLGVDQILRACRPAKCCRKAILNERQRTALPYSVSLKSLPLMPNDAEVIKQSIDMSVKKIKNSLDLTQAYKDKLAFYVSLGKDDFKPNMDFPWVIPVYDMKFNKNKAKTNSNKFFLLKKSATPKQVESINKLMGISKYPQITNRNRKLIRQKKYFILKRPSVHEISSSEEQLSVIRQKCIKGKHKNRNIKIRFKEQRRTTYDNENRSCFMKIVNCNQTRSIYKKKNIWSNVGHEDWRFIFAQEHNHVDLNCVDVQFGQTEISKLHCYNRSESNISIRIDRECNLLTKKHSKQSLESGDSSLSSIRRMLDLYLDKLDGKIKNMPEKPSDSKICEKKNLTNIKSTPTLLKRLSEKVFHASNALTFFVKPKKNLEKSLNTMHIPLVPYLTKERWLPSPKPSENKDITKIKQNLEYYVDLVNGDLVWSNTLPLKPQSYNTYYNYSNHSNRNCTPANTPVEDPMVAARITGNESQRGRLGATPQTDRGSRRDTGFNANHSGSTISELTPEHIAYLQSIPTNSPEKQRMPPEFASFSMEPESQDEPWAPLVVSETSLPKIQEELIGKVEVQKVEAEPLPPRDEPQPEEKVAKPDKGKCSSKPTCAKNNCTDCKKSECQSKKCHSRDIRIAIKKTNNGISVEGRAPKPCTKEICEIYKNKNMVSGKSPKDKDEEQKFTIKGKDNIEIYINNQKICVANNKKKKTTTEAKDEKK